MPLANPYFDQTWYQFEDVPELTIPESWSPWWEQGTPQQVADGFLKRPEYKPEPARLISQPAGVKWFTTFATHNAGLYQVVAVPAGKRVTVRASVQYWSEHTDGSGGALACCIGIHPRGGTSPIDPGIVWSAWQGQDDKTWDGRSWRQVEVSTVSETNQVTVFLRSACRYRAKHNDSYWDNIIFTVEGETPDPEDPEPEPGDPNIAAQLQDINDTLQCLLEAFRTAFRV